MGRSKLHRVEKNRSKRVEKGLIGGGGAFSRGSCWSGGVEEGTEDGRVVGLCLFLFVCLFVCARVLFWRLHVDIRVKTLLVASIGLTLVHALTWIRSMLSKCHLQDSAVEMGRSDGC